MTRPPGSPTNPEEPTMDETTLARIADEAYAKGCSAHDPVTRAYAHGVEDLAHLLSGEPYVASRLVSILVAAGLRGMVPS